MLCGATLTFMFFRPSVPHLAKAILTKGLRSIMINTENQNFLAMDPFLNDGSLTELGLNHAFATCIRKWC